MIDPSPSPEAAPRNITTRTAGGIVWLVASRFAGRICDLLTLIVLARVLTPPDFGLVALAMTAVYVVEAVLELPLNSALVRLPLIEQKHLDTAFTLSILRGLVVALALAATAFPYALIYGDPRLFPLIAGLALAPASRGIGSPALACWSQKGSFSRDFVMDVGGKLTASIVAITIALTTRSYWALAAGTISAPLVGSLISYIVAPYRPRFSLMAWRDFAGFAGWTSAAQVLSALNWQADRLILGRLVSVATVGRYAMASDLSSLPEQALLKPMMRPIMSGMVAVRSDASRLRHAYRRVDRTIVTLLTPIAIGLAMLAEPLLRLGLGEQWRSTAPLLSIFALTIIPANVGAALGAMAMALDETRVMFQRTWQEAVVRLPLLVGGILIFGLPGLLAARFIAALWSGSVALRLVRNLTGESIASQMRGIARPILAGGVATVATLPFLPLLTDSSGFKLIAVAAATGAVLMTTYVGTLLVALRWGGEAGLPERLLLDALRMRIVRRLSPT